MTPRTLAFGHALLALALTFSASATAQAPQTVTFQQPLPATSQTLSSHRLTAVASSGLPVQYTISGVDGVCATLALPPTFTDRVLLTIRPGTCTVTATQAGNAQWAPASASATIEVSLRVLEITFNPPASVPYGESFEAVAFTENPGYVPGIYGSGSCTVANRTVTMTSGLGPCVLTAWHAGNQSAEVVPATRVVQAQKRPIVVVGHHAAKFVGAADPLLHYTLVAGSPAFDDTFTGRPERWWGESPGTYTISSASLRPGGPDKDFWYDMTFVNAIFTIVPLEFTATSQPTKLGTPVTTTATFSDTGTGVAPRCAVDWHDPAVPAPKEGVFAKSGSQWTCTASHVYSVPGVHLPYAAVVDAFAGAGVRWGEVVVFDPNAGGLAAEGWVVSPAGAFGNPPGTEGFLAFSVHSSYANASAMAPSGQVHVQFNDPANWFWGGVQEWLLVDGRAARLRGHGLDRNGALHGFEVKVIDGLGLEPDRFRLMLWRPDGTVWYDSQPGSDFVAPPTTSLAGGRVRIGR